MSVYHFTENRPDIFKKILETSWKLPEHVSMRQHVEWQNKECERENPEQEASFWLEDRGLFVKR